MKRNLLMMIFVLGVVLVAIGVVRGQGKEEPPVIEESGFPDIVFVARSHLATPDRIFGDEVGPAGQFGTGIPKFAPNSRLVLREAGGNLVVYNTPGLVDVQSPDVSFDGTKIVFAGATTLNPEAADYGWRIYEINVDGSGFRQLTFSDRSITIPNAADFMNQETYGVYDDLFPAYMADGRIVFNSSRYPTRAHYDERRTFNVYVMDANGDNMHRISTERASNLHPTPLPDGRIMVSRWWNQFNQPSEMGIYNRIDNRDYDRVLADGTTILANPYEQFNPPEALLSNGYEVFVGPNTWHLMTMNPDGTDFQRFAWTPTFEWAITLDDGHDTYAATQPAVVLNGGQLHVAFTSQTDQTMVHRTLETGIRVARPGVDLIYQNTNDVIAGLSYEQAWGGDRSGPYAINPAGLPDGRILYSQSHTDSSLPTSGNYNDDGENFALQGSSEQYELYVMDIDGANKSLVPTNLASIGMATADAMDATPIMDRTSWTALGDVFTDVPSEDPLEFNLPNTMAAYWFTNHTMGDIETATIRNPNIYANAPLEFPFVNNSPPPGSVATAEVWVDANQFTGAFCYNGYPQPCDDYRQDSQVRAILWTEVPVSLAGEFEATVPADTMGFIVLRDGNGRIVRDWNRGHLSIAQGSAWARPNEVVECTGCHMGHVSGSVEPVLVMAEDGWTNVAPYAFVSASSYNEEDPMYEPFVPRRVVDRRGWISVPAGEPDTYQDDETGWISQRGDSVGEWIDLAWPSDVLVNSLRLVGPPPNGGDWGGFGQPAMYGDYYIESATVRLYRDGALIDTLSIGRIEPHTNGGTIINLSSDLVIDQLRLRVDSTSGRWWWDEVAALNEIEVIGQAAEPFPLFQLWNAFLPTILR